jgi:hypothetical protein
VARHKNAAWDLPDQPGYDAIKVGLLMDLRDELQKLNRVFECANFIGIPATLREIRQWTMLNNAKLDAIRKQTNRIPPRRKRRVTRRQGDV